MTKALCRHFRCADTLGKISSDSIASGSSSKSLTLRILRLPKVTINVNRLGSHGKDATGFSCKSRFNWPYQHRPPRTDFKFFCDTFRLTFCHDQSWQLRKRLGKWLLYKHYLLDWDWFYSAAERSAWKIDETGCTSVFALDSLRRQGRQFLYVSLIPSASRLSLQPPIYCVRATIRLGDHSKWEMKNSSTLLLVPPAMTTPRDPIDCFRHFFEETPETHALGYELSSSISILRLLDDIREGTAVVVSDGSCYLEYNKGAAR